MTKQKRVLEDLALYFGVDLDTAYGGLRMLSQHDVVIKVDRELPPLINRQIYDKHEMDIAIKQAVIMVGAGYVAVEPLIEEGK